ncbi:hypothetical protein E1B28_007712 [Marasmius oreades]|uniref:Cytochrome P450 n=1 Tax=Marasmius oreades TaxID=181124 RepID=A0A9P7S299_9AGAR|nr:uncharacterized protein E1B28_007712 [Marasmius oreades]KAG7094094.1 hypothetical protein E1B28_007712 [Marasmius oreades]
MNYQPFLAMSPFPPIMDSLLRWHPDPLAFALKACAVLATIVGLSCWTLNKRLYPSTAPPIVEIESSEMFNNPKVAYALALRNSKGIVGVRRKGRLEYIVDRSFTHQVLTDDSKFSFELGTLSSEIATRLDEAMAAVVPIFQSNVDDLVNDLPLGSALTPVDFEAFVHRTMASAMIQLILGKDYLSADNIKRVENIAVEVATLGGIFQNMSWFSRTFPSVWRIAIWIRVFLYSIPINFILGIGREVYHQLGQIDSYDKEGRGRGESDGGTAFTWARRYVDHRQGQIGVLDRFWILTVVLGMIFASVHQTAVVMIWMAFELAKRPEDVQRIREEMEREGLSMRYASLRRFEFLDSFIREVMRTKGDTLSTVRMTTMDVPLGEYVIPSGSFVVPLATQSHESEFYHGENARDFVGDRWVGQEKPSSMLSTSYWPFGLGRWACPGRTLAVAEIKVLMLLLLQRTEFALEGGDYKVVDPLTVTSVAPEGTLLLQRCV